MRFFPIVLIIAGFFLASCSGNKPDKSGGGYYGGDRPPSETRDYNSIPDAVPKIEPRSKTGNNPYEALGKNYVPLKSSKGFVQAGAHPLCRADGGLPVGIPADRPDRSFILSYPGGS